MDKHVGFIGFKGRRVAVRRYRVNFFFDEDHVVEDVVESESGIHKDMTFSYNGHLFKCFSSGANPDRDPPRWAHARLQLDFPTAVSVK